MATRLSVTAAEVLDARSYQDVFGVPMGTEQELSKQLKRMYRKFAKILHPDFYPEGPENTLADEAFTRLVQLYDQAASALTGGTSPLTVTTRKAVHELSGASRSGDLCMLYDAASALKSGEERPTVSKVANAPADNDLLQAEAAAIKRLRGPGSDPRRHMFVPELLDTFAYGERGHAVRQVNVLARLEGFYTLEQVSRAYPYPTGLPVLDMAWMWRRLLLVLGYAHTQGVLHGAVLPSHVMILPEQHGLVLVDWCYSATAEDGAFPFIEAVVERYRDWYPPEVLARQAPSAATDIIMAARCMVMLLGGDSVTGNFPASSKVPRPFRAFFRGCLSARQTARPQDAWELLQEFDALLERLGPPYFPRRFRQFTMPTGVV